MNIKPFAVEEWMNAYETGARYNIAETCVDSISLDELLNCREPIRNHSLTNSVPAVSPMAI